MALCKQARDAECVSWLNIVSAMLCTQLSSCLNVIPLLRKACKTRKLQTNGKELYHLILFTPLWTVWLVIQILHLLEKIWKHYKRCISTHAQSHYTLTGWALAAKANPNAEHHSDCLTYVVLLDAPSHLQQGQTLNKTKGKKKVRIPHQSKH